MALRREWTAALVVCGVIYGGTQAGIPPFSSLVLLGENLKQSWDEPAGVNLATALKPTRRRS